MTAIPKPARTAKKKRVKLESYKSLVQKADKAFSLYIRQKYNNTCVTCGSKKNPTCSHLISRTKRSVRWHVMNAVTQCAPCNFKHEYYPEALTQWWINENGLSAYNILIIRSNQVKKHTRDELKEIIRLCEEATK